MGIMDELTAIAATHGGIIETGSTTKQGISRAMLSKLCGQGLILRIAKGQYVLPDEIEDELLSISKRSNHLIFSHETALFLHGISDRVPFVHAITVPSNRAPSPKLKQQCKVYYVKRDLFELGRCTAKTPVGNDVPTYDLERTVCDVIRSRSRLGTETLLEALRLYAADPQKDLHRLNSYATLFHIENVLRQYLEVLL